MKLYGYWRSSATWRVRIALHSKGIAFEYVVLSLVRDGGEHRQESHLARNPIGQIPVLELDDGRHLAQSLAIIEYLDETAPARPLLPADPWLRGRARMIAEMVNSGIQPLQNVSTLREVKALGGDEREWSQLFIGRGLEAAEKAIGPTVGRYCVGDAVTLADVCLVPQLYNARRFGVDVAPYPRLLTVEAACAELPAFHAAHPDQQIDAEP
jgi:maleylpyruvate isomerase